MKDIRDIAAYWGSPCINAWVSMRSLGDPRYINASVLESLEANASPEFKVRLRPISSLTDEEVFNIADIAIAHGGTVDRLMCEVNRYESNEWEPIVFGNYHLRTDGSFYHSPYWISKYGLFSCGDGDDGNEVRTYEEAAVIAYLQSIHVYVPGTIDLKYVNLVE